MVEQAIEGWTATEQAIAERAFEQAYGRAISQLTATLQAKAQALSSADEDERDRPRLLSGDPERPKLRGSGAFLWPAALPKAAGRCAVA